MNRSRKVFLLVIALVSIMALASGQGALAGGVANQGDGQAGQPTTGVGGPAVGGSIQGGCDTLDAQATLVAQSNNSIVYKCDHNADLTDWTFETTTHNGLPVLHAQFKVSGVIPTQITDFGLNPGDPNPLHTGEALGLNFVMFFQNKARQNARQILGDTSDCQQHTHAGPYLSGNNEYLGIFYSINLEADNSGNPTVVTESGYAHFDPVGLTLYSRPQTGASPKPAGVSTAQRCVFDTTVKKWVLSGARADGGQKFFDDPGSQTDAVVSGNTLDPYVPQTFHSNSLAPLYLGSDYVLAAPGDAISGVFPQVQAEACLYCIPAIYDPTNPSAQLSGPSYLKTNPPVDWAPWGAYDLGQIENGGVLTVGTAAVPGATCSQISLALTGVGTYRQFLRGKFDSNGNLLDDRDNEIQINPAYGTGTPPVNGLSHYDSSKASGLRDQVVISQQGVTVGTPLGQQDHNGPEGCDTLVPGTQRNVGAASFTA